MTFMPSPRTAREVFDAEFLLIRAKLLEVAAILDRIDRSEGALSDDPRLKQVQTAIEILLRPEQDRAEQLQLVFSRLYDENWRQKLGIKQGG